MTGEPQGPDEPTADAPPAQEPQAQEPQAQEPQAQEPPAQEPQAQEPTIQEPTRDAATDQPTGDQAEKSTVASRDPRTGLAAVASELVPGRPPRRTGVFVDPDDLRTHVGGLLRAVLGGYEVDAFGNFTFTHEDARVFVTVGGSPVGPQVGVFCVTNLDIDLTPALASFLLTTNHTLGFGSFSYDAQNRAVWLRHTLLGTTLDLPELQTAVAAIATTAARIDEGIRDRFGGRTFQDAPGDVQRGMEPPEPSQEPDVGHAGGYL
jgi:hypothetical protein